MEQVKHLKDFQVIEFRRYTIKEGEREHFAQYFETYFPEAFEQLGAIIYGQFLERDSQSRFTWIRGFKDMDARATVSAAFYYGPLWEEHRMIMNNRLIDSDDVLLLRPLSQERGITVLPAVDPNFETAGAQGIVVAQIFAINPNDVDAFTQQAKATLAGYQDAGVREVGVLVTLDAKNNFPQLPIRTDGPYLVWLGMLKDDQALETQFNPLAKRYISTLVGTGYLRAKPESIVLDPTRRSRLRWLPAPATASNSQEE